jgi:hypothetical protein
MVATSEPYVGSVLLTIFELREEPHLPGDSPDERYGSFTASGAIRPGMRIPQAWWANEYHESMFTYVLTPELDNHGVLTVRFGGRLPMSICRDLAVASRDQLESFIVPPLLRELGQMIGPHRTQVTTHRAGRLTENVRTFLDAMTLEDRATAPTVPIPDAYTAPTPNYQEVTLPIPPPPTSIAFNLEQARNHYEQLGLPAEDVAALISGLGTSLGAVQQTLQKNANRELDRIFAPAPPAGKPAPRKRQRMVDV